MKIDRHNCEAFFLDYYENNLTPVEVAELLCFLEENPDLKEIFEGFESLSLSPEKIGYPGKEALKKKLTEDEIDRTLNEPITAVNAELFLIASAEGTLNPEQEFRLKNYLSEHPEWESSRRQISLSHLPAENIAWENKDQLRRILVTEENSEELMIRFVENDLAPFEKRALLAYAGQNAKARKELDLYKQAVLPSEQIIFTDKESLKKRQRKPILVTLFSERRTYYAAAAAILLLAGLFFFFRDTTEQEKFVAQKDTPVSAGKNVVISDEKEEPTFVEPQRNVNQKSEERVGESSSIKGTNRPAPSTPSKEIISVPQPDRAPMLIVEKEEQVLLAEVNPEPSTMMPAIALHSHDSLTEGTPSAAMAQAPVQNQDEYISAGTFLNRQLRKVLGIRKTDPCANDEKLEWWDVAMAAKQGLQRLTGTKAVEVNKNCEGEGARVEYVFTAGNFGVTRSVAR